MSIGRLDRWALEGGARAAYRLLARRGKRVVVADFDGAPEPLLMVYARGERAHDVAAALKPFLDESGD